MKTLAIFGAVLAVLVGVLFWFAADLIPTNSFPGRARHDIDAVIVGPKNGSSDGGLASAASQAFEADPQAASSGGGAVVRGGEPRSVHWASDRSDSVARESLASALAALKTDPSHPTALRDAAAAFSRLGHRREALSYLSRLVAVSPDDDAARAELATALMATEQWTDARIELDQIAARTPGDTRVWFNLAVVHQALGHLVDARQAWDRVLVLTPDDSDARARRGEVLLDLHEWRAAIDDFQSALRQAPDDDALALNLALAFRGAGRLADAERVLIECVRRRPNDVLAMSRLASLAWERASDGDLAQRDAARKWSLRVLAIDPKHAEARAILSELEARPGVDGPRR
ncbi:MAG: tetratricopeptide repeat protein [Phycisphaerae bacterium]